MIYRSNKDLKEILHPYLFVLQEGPNFKKDPMNYSLCMLRIGNSEVIKSPSFSIIPSKQKKTKATKKT